MNTAPMFSSQYDDWNTPEPVLTCVRRVDEIGLDPFSNEQSIVRARTEYRLSRGQDALRLPWDGFGLVFCNPPYGDAIFDCMARIAYWGARGVEILTLVPHRTDTEWYQEHVDGVAAKCEWYGRLQHMRGVADTRQLTLLGALEPALPAKRYDGPGESAPFPSVVLYHGHRIERFIEAFEDAGEIWVR